MAAIDTFEWYVSTQIKNPGAETRLRITEDRAYLLTLRSEDERQRFVDGVVEEMRRQ